MIQIPNKKQLYLTEDVNSSSCGKLIDQICAMNTLDREMVSYIESIGGKYTPANIELYISSVGGSIYDALGLYDMIRNSYTPITTIVTGYAMSAAGLIALAGDRRYCTTNSTFMIHTLTGGSWAPIEQVKEDTKVLSKLQERLNSIIIERTKITKQQLNDIAKRKADWYLDATKAIRLGIVEDLW